jgi:hypothetical protein
MTEIIKDGDLVIIFLGYNETAAINVRECIQHVFVT